MTLDLAALPEHTRTSMWLLGEVVAGFPLEHKKALLNGIADGYGDMYEHAYRLSWLCAEARWWAERSADPWIKHLDLRPFPWEKS